MSGPGIQTERKRILYLDYLRIFATIGVLLLHVSAQNWDTVELHSYERKVFFVFNNAAGWCVNMFMMISGALFLDNDRPFSLKKLFKCNILRMLTAFFFWSAIYAADSVLSSGAAFHSALQSFLQGNYHLWFIVMIVTYYLCTPILRKITESRKVTELFLLLIFIWAILIPSALEVLNYFNPPHTAMLADVLSYHHTISNFGFQRPFLFYYVLGFYLTKYDVPTPVRCAAPVLGIGGYLLRMFLTVLHIQKTGSGSSPFAFLMCDMLTGVGLFLFAKYALSRIRLSQKGTKVLTILSNYSFGVYLVHILVLNKLNTWLGLNTLSFNPILAVPTVLLAVLAIGYLISALLHQIPILKKYIV